MEFQKRLSQRSSRIPVPVILQERVGSTKSARRQNSAKTHTSSATYACDVFSNNSNTNRCTIKTTSQDDSRDSAIESDRDSHLQPTCQIQSIVDKFEQIQQELLNSRERNSLEGLSSTSSFISSNSNQNQLNNHANSMSPQFSDYKEASPTTMGRKVTSPLGSILSNNGRRSASLKSNLTRNTNKSNKTQKSISFKIPVDDESEREISEEDVIERFSIQKEIEKAKREFNEETEKEESSSYPLLTTIATNTITNGLTTTIAGHRSTIKNSRNLGFGQDKPGFPSQSLTDYTRNTFSVMSSMKKPTFNSKKFNYQPSRNSNSTKSTLTNPSLVGQSENNRYSTSTYRTESGSSSASSVVSKFIQHFEQGRCNSENSRRSKSIDKISVRSKQSTISCITQESVQTRCKGLLVRNNKSIASFHSKKTNSQELLITDNL